MVRLGQWVIALTVAIQRWAGDSVWRGRLLDSDTQWWRLAIPWHRGSLLHRCVAAGDEFHRAVVATGTGPVPLQELHRYFSEGLDHVQERGLGAISLRFAEAAAERDIPVEAFPNHVQLGWGVRAEHMSRGMTGRTSAIATSIVRNKPQASQMLHRVGIPVPPGVLVSNVEKAEGRR